MNMRPVGRQGKLPLLGWLTLYAGSVAFAAFFVSAHAGVRGSKHDLGAGGGAQATTAATTEVCVFCHTPHGANLDVKAPLWNKASPGGTVYTRYSSLPSGTLDGPEAPVGSVSLACLSCHDGTQAMDVVINRPGSGARVAAGAEIDALNIGAMTGTPIPNLTTDLRDDHPISIQYGGGGCAQTDNSKCTGDPDFSNVQFATINTQPAWWVDTTGGTAGRDKTDMILYTRSDGPGATNAPYVECGSCHDPHEDLQRPVSFMRISNDTSNVCLACHLK
ncbi:MAG: cytochrome c3 family protein [Burkholderiales bacterium]